MRAVLLLAFALCGALAAVSAPAFPDQYYVKGIFSIPYFNISEPIELWYDAVNNREVVSYYNGTDIFITLGDQNITYYINPEIDTLVCGKVAGDFGPLLSLFPDLDEWVFSGNAMVDNLMVEDWRLSIVNYSKSAQYDFFFTNNSAYPVPVQLYLNGVDFVFDSHPDVYIMDYGLYLPNYVDEMVFKVPEICQNAREIPMSEMRRGAALMTFDALRSQASAPASVSDVEKQFLEFIDQHGKKYENMQEYKKRLAIFQETVAFIEKHNADPTQTHKVGLNRFADLSDAEFKAQMLPRKGRTPSNAGSVHVRNGPHSKDLPREVDWRQKGAVTPVKDQGVCGSCYSFGSTGSLEGVNMLANGELISLSEQQIVDCSWTDDGNQGCNGGEASFVYQWIINNGGIATEASYPYLMQDSFCKASNTKSGIVVQSYVNVTAGEEDLKDAVANVGPVAVAIDASHPPFRYYMSGVYYQPDCSNSLDDLDHEVLAVGYGTFNGTDYWLVKNSWSTHWGNEGYVMMIRNKDNNCGIATQPTYPVV